MIIIPGEPEPQSPNSLLSTRWVRDAMVDRMKEILRNQARYDSMRRVMALRESCGIKTKVMVSVRVPAQYNRLA